MINKISNITSDKFLNSKYSFFIANSFGWFLFWLFSQIVILSTNENLTQPTFGNLIAFFSGYLTTFLLGYFYKKFIPSSLAKFKSWIYIFILCVIHTHIWLTIDFVIFGLTMYDFFELWEWLNLNYYLQTLMIDMVRLIAWTLIFFIIKILIDWKQLSERKINAELHAKNLEIQILRYQLNPHFLFNSLNSIRALTLKDIKRSREMISELSEFLKYNLINKNNSKISLLEEIEAVKHFCTIEKIRFQDKLNIKFDIDPKTEKIQIPSLILHPLVENAIKFGMETNQNVLKVYVKSFISENNLILEITNTGRWINQEDRNKISVAGTNTGLENVKQILINTYPEKHTFEIIKEESLVKIRIVILVEGEK